jgi:hypothetical protein
VNAGRRRWQYWLIPAALLLAWVTILATESLPLVTELQRLRMAQLLADPPAPADVDGYAALWTLSYNLPDNERNAVLAQDIARHAARGEHDGRPDPLTVAARYPRLVGFSPGRWSGGNAQTKLDRLIPQHAAIQSFVHWHDALLGKLVELERLQNFPDVMPDRFWSAFPELQLLRFRALQLAMTFHAGRTQDAMTGMCQYIGFLRRLRSTSHDLLHENIGNVYAREAVGLLADMSARAGPPGDPACESALAPLQDAELDSCAAMGQQLRWIGDLLEQVPESIEKDGRPRPLGKALIPLLINRQHVLARNAESLGVFCDPQVQRRSPQLEVPVVPDCTAAEWVLDPLGCPMIGTEVQFNSYQRKRLDLDRALRAFAIARWLAQRSAPLKATLDELPPALRLADGDVELDAAAGVIRIGLLFKKQEATFDVAIPWSRAR